MDVELVEFNIENVLNEISNLFSDKSEKSIEFIVDCSQTTPKGLIGDPHRLEQVIINLVNNAFKFTNKGKIILSVDKIDEAGDEVLLRFSISDTGIGIEPDKLNKIFESFTQTDTSTTRKYGGTGLGLAITKELIELMGGTVDVNSTLDEGSVFTFEIKFRTHQNIHPRNEIKDSKDIQMDGARVLVAEDNSINQQVISELLAHHGIRVDIANNGQEAFDKIRNDHYDLVLMDGQMPVMDGYQAAKEIRKLPEFTELPIIAVTAYALESEKEKAIAAGMNEHVSKPIDPVQLEEVLSKWLPIKNNNEDRSVVDDQFKQELNKLRRIDIDIGLARVRNKYSTYHNILISVYDNHSRDIEIIKEALSNNDKERAKTITHTLKSVIANIGAMDLYKTLRFIESEIASDNDIKEILAECEQDYAEMINSLEPLKMIENKKINQTHEVEEMRGQLDIKALNEALKELSNKIKTQSYDAGECLFYIEKALNGTEKRKFEKLKTAVDTFQFSEAKTIVDELVTIK